MTNETIAMFFLAGAGILIGLVSLIVAFVTRRDGKKTDKRVKGIEIYLTKDFWDSLTEGAVKVLPGAKREAVEAATATASMHTADVLKLAYLDNTTGIPIVPVIKSAMAFNPVRLAGDSATPLDEGETPEAGTNIFNWRKLWPWGKKK